MPIVKLLVEKNMKEKRFFEDINKRLEPGDMVKNPFTAQMHLISREDDLIVIMDLEPLYPDMIPKVGLFLAGVSLLFDWTATMIIGLVLASTWFFWTDRFFYLVLNRARKKKGLEGRIKLLSNKEAWRGVLEGWDR